MIHDNLIDIYNKFEIQVFPDVSGLNKQYVAKRKSTDQVMDLRFLKMQLDISRENDLMEYFKEPTKVPISLPNPQSVAALIDKK